MTRTKAAPNDSTQGDAFKAHARHSDPETSKQAARSLGDLRASHLRVLQLFRVFGDMDDRSLLKVAKAEGAKMSDSGLRSRRSELVRQGHLRDTGKRVGYEGGRSAIVWGLPALYYTGR
ncbi:MAG: hypothetical protein ACRDQZ_04725 [Mycobacteriales bacterium]